MSGHPVSRRVDVAGGAPSNWPPARWLWPALVVICFCAPLFVGLGRADLANDEAIYSFSVDAMIQSGDWLVPRSIIGDTSAFLEKPPLKCWIVAVPIRLGLLPHDEFGLRFWDALFGGLAFLYVFLIGRRMGGPLCGVGAVLVLFAHRPLLFDHGLRENNMEAALVLCYCGGMYHFLAWRTAAAARRRSLHVLAIGLFFVLGFMTKFVAALFLPLVLVLTVSIRRDDRLRALGDWRALAGTVLVVAALCVPWFAFAYHRFGRELWDVMVGAHVYTRFTASLDPTHLQPWHYYVSRLVTEFQASGCLWLAAAGAALLLGRTLYTRWVEGQAVVLWFVLPLVLISLGTSKLYHYTYPFLPPVALAIGYLGAVVVDWATGLMTAIVTRVHPVVEAVSRRPIGFAAVRIVLPTLGLAALGVAIAVLVLGHLRLAVGHTVLFRTSSAVRPMIVAIVMFAFSPRPRRVMDGLVPISVFVMVLPIAAYRLNLARLGEGRHPLRTLAECMQPIAARQVTDDSRGPGVYVESYHLLHPLSYYMRRIGPWRQGPERSEANIYAALHLKQQPVLLSDDRYEQFKQAMNDHGAQVVAEAARIAGVEADRARAAQATEVFELGFDADQLLLPGPYLRCALVPGRTVR